MLVQITRKDHLNSTTFSLLLLPPKEMNCSTAICYPCNSFKSLPNVHYVFLPLTLFLFSIFFHFFLLNALAFVFPMSSTNEYVHLPLHQQTCASPCIFNLLHKRPILHCNYVALALKSAASTKHTIRPLSVPFLCHCILPKQSPSSLIESSSTLLKIPPSVI